MPATVTKVTPKLTCRLDELRSGDWFLVRNDEVDEECNLRMLTDRMDTANIGYELTCVQIDGTLEQLARGESVIPVEVEVNYTRP